MDLWEYLQVCEFVQIFSHMKMEALYKMTVMPNFGETT